MRGFFAFFNNERREDDKALCILLYRKSMRNEGFIILQHDIFPAMNVLVVTGRLAQEMVRSQAANADVLVADVDVAAFITPKMLQAAGPKGYDLILIPGAITADFREAEKALDTTIRLGPKHAADIGLVLRHLDDIELSDSIPACALLESELHKRAREEEARLENMAGAAMQIRGVKIGGSSRMKVLAEVVDATRLKSRALAERIRYYEEQGADMIDLGVPLDAGPDQVKEAMLTARKATELPLSVDTTVPELILAGLEAGADLVLSLSGGNLSAVGEAVFSAGVPAVIIPGPGQTSLEENLVASRQMGIAVIADPVLDPPLHGLASSLQRYILFAKDHPHIPLFFGAGNVTELLDADTPGSNALLAALGAETGASVLFTPEYSSKALGSVHELRVASQMMLLAKERRSPPKDLGSDLLVLKEKRHLPVDEVPERFIPAQAVHEYVIDPAGSFRISITHDRILVKDRSMAVVGDNARDILNTLLDAGAVSRLDHAGYLGRELEKAEIALRLKRSYCQDESLFPAKKVK
jgi:dihydropteroate synthase-like protein